MPKDKFQMYSAVGLGAPISFRLICLICLTSDSLICFNYFVDHDYFLKISSFNILDIFSALLNFTAQREL